ncbi:hypothetical protein A7D00_5647 [Trichophyton violaceum]|uniref:Uncharacterized protein n=1 Tax=Trichophyton violaceum TaxID=34388 RepID=A0A178FFC7_TRIVO|nr:hypothetical protein A7D00_5647 [Trichophyton violaceum]
MSNQLQSGHFFAVVPVRSTWNQKLETRDEVEHEGWFLPACEEEDVSSLATQDGHINFDIRIIDEKKSVVQPPAVAPTGDPSMDRLPTHHIIRISLHSCCLTSLLAARQGDTLLRKCYGVTWAPVMIRIRGLNLFSPYLVSSVPLVSWVGYGTSYADFIALS